ncbi:hypothetical protein OAB57_03820 [Bacteriovoracaceae bacterium]|nr:hypothetical protein [Bacteriovoracaceae bacterium]
MKISEINLKGNNFRQKIKIIVCLLVLSSSQAYTQTKNSIWVSNVSGNAFSVRKGKTKFLQKNLEIKNRSSIITEENSVATLFDPLQHTFFLAGKSHLEIGSSHLLLKRGYFWINSDQSSPYTIKTANASIDIRSGEYLLSFDPINGKTQVLVITGEATLSNAINTNLQTEVLAGQFSFVQDNHNNGKPRLPTAIGYESFKKIVLLFKGNVTIDKKKKQLSRSLASEKLQKPNHNTKLSSFYQELLKEEMKTNKNVVSTKKKISNVRRKYQGKPIQIFGRRYTKQPTKWKSKKTPTFIGPTSQKRRKPVFVKRSKKKRRHSSRNTAAVKSDSGIVKSFESSLKKKYREQTRHSKDVNGLINELKAFSGDYRLGY